MTDDSLARRGRAMEDAFFHDLDAKLVEKIRLQSESAAQRAELVRTTGIKDETLLDELVALGVTGESLVAMRLVPMLMVAWADREVSPEERATIVCEAEKMGIGSQSVPGQLLDTWLAKRPSGDLLEAWQHYTAALFASMPERSRRAYLDELSRELNLVARASGGILGIGSVSESEAAMIEKIVGSFASIR